MIIYALIIIAALFFLSWNLIEKSRIHFVASLVTTLLFLITVSFAVANFGYHYGMHLVNKSPRTQLIESASPQASLKMIAYRSMGTKRSSQIVIYRYHHQITHTKPDSKVTNQIVRSDNVESPHMVTTESKWQYRNSTDRFWFGLAKKPSTNRVHHVFYVPKSWRILSVKQTMALKQIIKNRSRQLNSQMKSPQAKQQIRQKATMYTQGYLAKAIQKNPKMSNVQKRRLTKRAMNSFRTKMKQESENKLISEALQTVKTIN